MVIDGLTTAYFEGFFLALVRAVSLMVAAPAFGHRGMPVLARVGLAASIAFLVSPGLSRELPLEGFLLQVAQEALIGLLLGLAVSFAFAAVQMGAAMLAVQMGLSLGGVLDPSFAGQGSVVERFYGLLATVVFFAIDGHHQMLLGLSQSFQLVPVGTVEFPQLSVEGLIGLSGGVFVSALRIALPLAGTLALVDAGLGILGRAVPQFNLLLLGMPLKMLLGLVLMIVTMPLVVGAVSKVAEGGMTGMLQMLAVR